MAKYVCPVHEDVILFRDDEERDLRRAEVRIVPPQYCEKCGKHYYQHECNSK